jgi:eukaryotic translation initiation factor 2C
MTAAKLSFENKEGKKVSVQDYFQSEMKIKLRYPNMLLAMKANGKTAFPMEVLAIVPATRAREKLTGEQTSDMIKVMTQVFSMSFYLSLETARSLV